MFRRIDYIGWICVAIVYSTIAATATAQPARRPAPTIVVVRDGATDWRIALATDAGEVERFAAGELRKYVEKISGARIADAEGNDTKAPLIRLEISAQPATKLVGSTSQEPLYDAYRLVVTSASITITASNPRAALYGVYDLLERLGCRWFYPTQDPKDPESVPASKTLALEAGTWSQSSPMKYRIANGSSWFFKMDMVAAAKQLDWAAKCRYNTMGWQGETDRPLAAQYEGLKKAGLLDELRKRGMFLHGPAHCFNLLLPDSEYMATHPEWFGMRDGKRVPQNFFGAQFCWSNAAARKQFVENVDTFAKAAPELKILCIVPFDGGKACECPECKKVGASNTLMQLMREVIDRLSETAPQLEVETVGGYGPMDDPPSGVEIHPRQRVTWAHWGRYYDVGYGDPKYGKRDNLEKWRKAAGGGLTLCQYYTDNFAEPWVMPPFALALAADRQYFLEKHVDSVYLLMWPPGYWWNHGLNGYISGRCFYDVTLDPFAVIQDYAVHYYGPAAGPLIAAYYTEWAREIDLAYRVRGDSKDEHRAMLANQRKRYIAPAMLAAADDPILAYRVGKVEKLHALAERLTEMHRQQREIRSLRKEGVFAAAELNLASARKYTDEVMQLFYKLADLNQGLMDRNEVGGFIKMAVKNWIDEEAKAIAAEKK